jgi:hypothetical protein
VFGADFIWIWCPEFNYGISFCLGAQIFKI